MSTREWSGVSPSHLTIVPCSYTGKLYAPQERLPSRMIVRFPLSMHFRFLFLLLMSGHVWTCLDMCMDDCYSDVAGSSSFIVVDTDYDSQAMVCTCQVKRSIHHIIPDILHSRILMSSSLLHTGAPAPFYREHQKKTRALPRG